jgi:hypothetical protein
MLVTIGYPINEDMYRICIGYVSDMYQKKEDDYTLVPYIYIQHHTKLFFKSLISMINMMYSKNL